MKGELSMDVVLRDGRLTFLSDGRLGRKGESIDLTSEEAVREWVRAQMGESEAAMEQAACDHPEHMRGHRQTVTTLHFTCPECGLVNASMKGMPNADSRVESALAGMAHCVAAAAQVKGEEPIPGPELLYQCGGCSATFPLPADATEMEVPLNAPATRGIEEFLPLLGAFLPRIAGGRASLSLSASWDFPDDPDQAGPEPEAPPGGGVEVDREASVAEPVAVHA